MFNPSTALITTGISEVIVLIWHYLYAKESMKINVEILSKKNVIYFVLGILFIPISLIIRKFKLGFLLTLLLIILICSFMYFIVLYIKKDNNLLFILDKFKGKLKVGRK